MKNINSRGVCADPEISKGEGVFLLLWLAGHFQLHSLSIVFLAKGGFFQTLRTIYRRTPPRSASAPPGYGPAGLVIVIEFVSICMYTDWSVQVIELVPAHAFGTLEISPQASYYLPGSPNSIIILF